MLKLVFRNDTGAVANAFGILGLNEQIQWGSFYSFMYTGVNLSQNEYLCLHLMGFVFN